MTHVFFLTRGHYTEVQKFIDSILKVQLKTISDIPYPDGKVRETYIQMGLQPIQLWSLTFPKEYQDLILASLFPDRKGKIVWHQRFYQKFFNFFRWCLRLKKCPDYSTEKNLNDYIYGSNVQKVFIGLKDDTFKENGTENL